METATSSAAERPSIVAALPAAVLVDPGTGDFDISVVGALRHFWRWIALATLAFFAVVLILQARAAPRYPAYAVLSPTNSANSGPLSKLGRLASIAGIDLSSAKPASNFERFQFLLTSPQLAAYQIREHGMLQIVFADNWDSARRQWKPATGIGAGLRGAIDALFGLPAAGPPDAQALALYYGRALDQQKVPDTGLIRLIYRDSSPERAARILRLIVDDANELLRREAATQAQRQAVYLRLRLAQTSVSDYRQTLLDLLTEQEQTLLLSNGAMPFAAEEVEAVNASSSPTKRPLLYASIAGVIGFSLASLVAVVAFNRRAHRRSLLPPE